jgi:ubiquilin
MAAAGGGGSGDGGGGESSPPSPGAALATLNIRSANGTKFTVRADLGSTVGAFKEAVAGISDVPAPQQRLIYKGRILKDEQTLDSYGACPHTHPHLHIYGKIRSRFGMGLASTVRELQISNARLLAGRVLVWTGCSSVLTAADTWVIGVCG